MGAETHRYVDAFITQLRHSGVRHAVIAPGSRSTPLTLAFARDPSFRAWLHLDERSAGYFALGIARQLDEPVALVCTSGTAAANFLPAIVEALFSRVPLVVLTADRPPELRGVGANQTIHQPGLYGAHAKQAIEMPITDGSPELDRHARGVASRAAAAAREAPAGPVHVNFPFREPLLVPGWEQAFAGLPPLEVATRPVDDAATPAAALVARVAGRRGVIVCGPEQPPLPAASIAALAAELGWPVLADPLSGVRAGRHRLGGVIDCYEALLRSPVFAEAARSEVVLRFGAWPASRPLAQYLAAQQGAGHILVDGAGGWRDPDALATTLLRADPRALCDAAAEALGAARRQPFAGLADDPRRSGGVPETDPAWLALWTAANAVARRALRDAIRALDEPFEGAAPLALAAALPEGATLVVGNSMPVRDMEAFFPSVGRDLRIAGTRGASGIDGVVSTAAGAAAVADGPVVLLIGDLSFLHDLNGLWPLRRYGLSLTVLLVNNGGGGIFHFLPQAEHAPDQFEEWFGTPHGLDFRHAVELHGGAHRVVAHGQLEAALRQAVASKGLQVVELRTDRERNVALHRRIWARVDAALREAAATDSALAPMLPAAPTRAKR